MSSLPSRRSQRRTYASKDLHEDFGARPLKSRVISLRRVTDDERLSDGAEAPPLFGTVEAPLDAFGVDDLVRHLTERKRLGFSVMRRTCRSYGGKSAAPPWRLRPTAGTALASFANSSRTSLVVRSILHSHPTEFAAKLIFPSKASRARRSRGRTEKSPQCCSPAPTR
jgi:hypothetical protein